ncbi:MAG TPA: DUF6596 domain-containing protein, partial [Fimbriimonas sp.]|nr:DUF6596 domain-containing protein [Fimbriimonas sp.]
LLPNPEVLGLLALMLFNESRRYARANQSGDIILLPDQDRSLWNQELIKEGINLVARASAKGSPGPYLLQAAISGVHASAPNSEATDWQQIIALYDRLLILAPSPVIQLNRGVAVAMKEGPAAGLEIVDALLAKGALTEYALAHSTRAEFCRRLNKFPEAKSSFNTALQLATLEPERRFLKQKLAELEENKT